MCYFQLSSLFGFAWSENMNGGFNFLMIIGIAANVQTQRPGRDIAVVVEKQEVLAAFVTKF